MRNYAAEVKSVVRATLVTRIVGGDAARICTAYRQLRERGELPPLKGAGGGKTDAEPAGHHLTPKHHDLRMVYHQARLEVGGEPVPRQIKEKYMRRAR